jgi:ATP-dependent protease ClpP protease subunit
MLYNVGMVCVRWTIKIEPKGCQMEFEIIDLPQQADKPNSVWDKLVPIVKNGNRYDVYLLDPIQAPCNYNELCHLLVNATSKDVVYLHLNTPGGQLDSANMVISALRECEASVVAKLSGDVASAGTMIALACDEIECEFETEFMIHYFSSGSGYAKGHEIKTRQAFMDRHMREVFGRVYKGFLSEKEIESVIDGQDIWLNGDEVKERFAAAKGAKWNKMTK